ncbi:MAG TPA: GNAT family N-acetyltransferase [Pseudonocardiaceae bacterium]|jgi:predicted acetyltransferase
MTVAVRDFEQADLDWVNKLRSVAFGGPTWGSLPLEGWRGFVAELPDGPCGFLRIHDYAQFFGGVAVPMGGLASVAVTPHARGRGVASALLDTALVAMREGGQWISALFPSVAPLYRGRGWEQVGVLQWLDLRIDRLLRFGDPQADLRPATQDDLPGMLDAYREVAVGIDGTLDRHSNGFRARHLLNGPIADVAVDVDGRVRGYLAGERARNDVLVVNELVATDASTAAGLLGAIGSWAGQLEQVAVRVLDMTTCRQLLPLPMRYQARFQPWMLRVVDFPAAVAARGWPAAPLLRPFTVDLEITDASAPWHAGRHRLVVDEAGVRCEPGGSGAVRLTGQGLGPWYAGSASTAALRRLGLLDGDPAQAALLDALHNGGSGEVRLADAF